MLGGVANAQGLYPHRVVGGDSDHLTVEKVLLRALD
jgi:hypothetical protein